MSKEITKDDVRIVPPSKDDKIILGGLEKAPSYEEYIDIFEDEFKPHMRAICEYVRDNLYGYTGQRAGLYAFKVEAVVVGFTWRAWGDMMQAIENERNGYMKFYM